jgi:carboxymethylenebutenolidase
MPATENQSSPEARGGKNAMSYPWLAAICMMCVGGRLVTAEVPQQSANNSKQSEPTQRVMSEAVMKFRKKAQPVTFPSRGLMLHGWIYKTESHGEGPFPAIIWNHGSEKSPKAQAALGMFYTQQGYVVFIPVRQGHEPSPGKYIQDALEEAADRNANPDLARKKIIELQEQYNGDVVAAIEWLRQQPFVDGKRLAVSGCSYGGIQTLLTAEKGLGVRAFVSFAPGAMSWANPELRRREAAAVQNTKAPLFLLQAQNDYSTGPSELLGPMLQHKGGLNRAKLYPAFGTTNAEGHGAFACTEDGIRIWGQDVIDFLNAAGLQK